MRVLCVCCIHCFYLSLIQEEKNFVFLVMEVSEGVRQPVAVWGRSGGYCSME